MRDYISNVGVADAGAGADTDAVLLLLVYLLVVMELWCCGGDIGGADVGVGGACTGSAGVSDLRKLTVVTTLVQRWASSGVIES